MKLKITLILIILTISFFVQPQQLNEEYILEETISQPNENNFLNTDLETKAINENIESPEDPIKLNGENDFEDWTDDQMSISTIYDYPEHFGYNFVDENYYNFGNFYDTTLYNKNHSKTSDTPTSLYLDDNEFDIYETGYGNITDFAMSYTTIADIGNDISETTIGSTANFIDDDSTRAGYSTNWGSSSIGNDVARWEIEYDFNVTGMLEGYIELDYLWRYWDDSASTWTSYPISTTLNEGEPIVIFFDSDYVDQTTDLVKIRFRFAQNGYSSFNYYNFEGLKIYNTAVSSWWYVADNNFGVNIVPDGIAENDKNEFSVDYIKIGSLGNPTWENVYHATTPTEDEDSTNDYVAWKSVETIEYTLNLGSSVDALDIIAKTELITWNNTFSFSEIAMNIQNFYTYQFDYSDGSKFSNLRVNTTTIIENSKTNGFTANVTYDLVFQSSLNGTWKILETNTQSDTTFSSFQTIRETNIHIEKLSLGRQDVTNNLRGQIKYNHQTQGLFKLEITTDQLGVNVSLRLPYSLELSSINPFVATFENANHDLWFISNYIGLYTILFSFGEGYGFDYKRQNQIVALNDVSSDYMTNQGFESGTYQADWFDSPTFDSVSIDTSIVFDGSFSVKLVDTDSGYEDFSLNYLDDGDYYISFSYYIESWSGGALLLYHYDSTWSGNSETLDTSITNRWVTYFTYFHVSGSSGGRNIAFERTGVSGSATFYLDNFKIWKVSGQQSNLGLSEYEFSSQFIYWDGYKNPAATNIDVEWSLRDRTADTEIISKSLITDNLGYAYYDFKGNLEMKEYESRWFSWDSFFIGNELYENSIHISSTSLANWGDWTHTGETITYDSANKEIDFDDTLTSTTHDIRYYPSTNYNLEHADYFIFAIKVVSTVNNPFLDYFNMRTTISDNWAWYKQDYFETAADDPILTTYQRYGYDVISSHAVKTGNPDITNIDFIEFRISQSIGEFDWSINEFKFIQAQKNYFTPIPSSYVPFSYETKQDLSKNYWDFSEDTFEGWTVAFGATNNLIVDGTNQFDLATSTAYGSLWKNSAYTIDFDYYNTAIVRIKVNDSTDSPNFAMNNNGGTPYTTPVQNIVGTEYNILEFDISIFNNPYTLRITTDFGSGSTTVPIHYSIDYLYFVHKDTDHDQGVNYEFEENEDYTPLANDELSLYPHIFQYASPTLIEVQQGKLHVIQDGSGVGIFYSHIYTGNNLIDDFDYISIVINVNVLADAIHFRWGLATTDADLGSYISSTVMITSVGEYNLVVPIVSGANTLRISGLNNLDEWEIEYLRFLKSSEINALYETEEYFYFQSENNSLAYYYEMDGFTGYAFDNEIIWKNVSIGSHELIYTAIASTDPEESRYQFLQLQTSMYYYSYSVINEFNIQVQDFSLSDYYVTLQVDSTKDYSYRVLENGSEIAIGSGLSTGTSIQTVRNTTTGLIIYAVEFTNGTDTLTRNYSYSNAKPAIEKTLVHFRLSNEAGVGLDFITAKVVVNGSTINAADRYYLPGTFLNISVYSWTNDLVLTINATVQSSEHDIVLVVPILEQEFNNKYDFDIMINLKSTSNTNYSISYVVSSSSSLIIEMFAGDFTATYTPLDPPNGDNGTHILAFSSITQTLEIRKGLSAVNVVTSLVATKLEDVRISYFERYILGPMLVVFGTLSLIGIFVALIFFGFRSLLANIIRENLLEPGAQKVGETSGIYDLSDSDDISLNKRKLSYKNKHI